MLLGRDQMVHHHSSRFVPQCVKQREIELKRSDQVPLRSDLSPTSSLVSVTDSVHISTAVACSTILDMFPSSLV